jgi:predicted dehydrogenase
MKSSRRSFIRNTALASAAFIIPRHVLGNGVTAPSDRINIGFIGLGKQSRGLARGFAGLDGVQIVAGSDAWQSKMQWFANHVATEYAKQRDTDVHKGVALHGDYRELLENSEIDAVVVATPDHWHAVQSIDAMRAGKDVFCEKPLTRTIGEGVRFVQAAKETGRIVQTGSMQRSRGDFRRACELVRNGYLGDITRVEVNVGDPARGYDLDVEPTPIGLDWNAWCGPSLLNYYNHRLAPSSNDVKFWPDWRLFREYGGGILADWGAHMFDIVQWALGMDRSGPVKLVPPNDPSAVRGLKMVYANGVEVVHRDFGRGWAVRFHGSEGTLGISRKFFESDPEGLVAAEPKPGEIRLYDTGGNHLLDWVNSIRDRSAPICDAETGHRSASVCSLANIAYRLNRPLEWDPVTESFPGDAEANRMTREQDRDFRVLDAA